MLSLVLLLILTAPTQGPPSSFTPQPARKGNAKCDEPVALEQLPHVMQVLSNPSAAYLPSDERVSSHRLKPTSSERLSARVNCIRPSFWIEICLGNLSRLAFSFFFFEKIFVSSKPIPRNPPYPTGFSSLVNIPWIGASQSKRLTWLAVCPDRDFVEAGC